jgi:protein-L-isoaspartate(D-aspartate) O-methyltransferase
MAGEPGASRDTTLATRRALVETIEREVRWSGIGDGSERLDRRVVAALLAVQRERFVPPDLAAQAYDNRPLPIGHGQTISQPLVVALMTHLLHLKPQARVLEVGTGSGYQTAILAELAAQLVTIEVVADLAAEARARLEAAGYTNIAFEIGDGGRGCPARAPFDGIIVTAAARAIPPALIAQLAPGGRLVIPRGGGPLSQELMLVEKDQAGQSRERALFPVAFVPLTGGDAC